MTDTVNPKSTRAALPNRRQGRGHKLTLRIRAIQIDGDIAYVPLTKGYIATIDADDVHLVDGWNWYAKVANHTVYAVRSERRDGRMRAVYLHRVILNLTGPLDGDHIDCNGLNNRRCNLRSVTRSQNLCNRRATKSEGRLRGASWHRQRGKWLARISVDGRQVCLGYFDTEQAAHEAYVSASALYHGEYGRTG